MYDLSEINGFVSSVVYEFLDSLIPDSETVKYFDKFLSSVEDFITAETGYSSTDFVDDANPAIKSQLLPAFAWIIQYYSFTHIDVNDKLSDVIVNNYKNAKQILSSINKPNDEDESTGASSVVTLNDLFIM